MVDQYFGFNAERAGGVYVLLDRFGNREQLYRDSALACLDPIPLKPRLRPPVLPVQTAQARNDRREGSDPAFGTVLVMNAYESDRPWPAGTTIKRLRVVALFPKHNFYGAYNGLEEQARGGVVRPLHGIPDGLPFERLLR